jgi:hypothetical protein
MTLPVSLRTVTPSMSLPVEKIFWHGQHTTFGFSSPLGKLPRSALRHLVALGWTEVERTDCAAIPALVWSSRRAADFPACGRPDLPLVRMLPQSCLACLDDKVYLANLLSRHNVADVCPPSFTDLAALRESLESSPSAVGDSLAPLWFIKHRHGVKGKAVTPMREPALLEWLGRHGSAADFAVQREVFPPALWLGRKFAIRAHVLVACTGGDHAGAAEAAAWLHTDVLVLPHALAHDARTDDKAVHVSNVGKGHPPPCRTTELPVEHPAAHSSLWPQLTGLASRTLRASRRELLPQPRCAASTLYAVLALDVALDAAGVPWLLEVNSHPALGDGTMSAVQPSVYTQCVPLTVHARAQLPHTREQSAALTPRTRWPATANAHRRLVADVVNLLVLPALGEAPPTHGGWVGLPRAFGDDARDSGGSARERAAEQLHRVQQRDATHDHDGTRDLCRKESRRQSEKVHLEHLGPAAE